MAAGKKTAVKAVEAKETVAAVETAVPAETSKTPEVKKEAPKKPVAKKPAAPKKAVSEEPAEKKAPVKKAPAKKEEMKAAVYVQFAGKEAAVADLTAAVKKAYVEAGHKESEIKTLDIYVKPEENAAYYVVNGEGSEEFKIVY